MTTTMTKKMNKYIYRDLTGQRFGRLTVIKYTDKRNNRGVVWLCRCDCGNLIYVRSTSLVDKNTQSCGCLHKERLEQARFKHGDYGTRLYATYHRMKNRCLNPNNKNYKYYGGKGVQICPKWKENYLAFKKWALANGYKSGLTIDRIDNDGDYSPQNCQFITQSENSKRSVKLHIKNRKRNKLGQFMDYDKENSREDE